MEHLLTIASDEWGGRMRWIPEDRDETFAGEHQEASFASGRPSTSQDALAAHAIQLGDIGCMYLFTRTTCQNRPLDGCVQMT